MNRTLPRAESASWVRVSALFTIAGLAEGIYISHLYSFVPNHLTHLGIAEADVAHVTATVTAIASAVGIPFVALWGALADGYSRKPIIIRSFLVLFASALVMILAGGFWTFVIGRALVPLSLGSTGLMLTTLSERVPQQRIGLAFTLVNGATPIGIFLGPPLGGGLYDAYGMNALLALDGAILLVIALMLSLGYRDHFEPQGRHSLLRMAADSVLTVMRSPRLRSMFIALALLVSGWMTAYAQMPVVVSRLHSGDSLGRSIGWVMGASGFAVLLINPAMGVLSGRLGRRAVIYGGAALLCALFAIAGLSSRLLTLALGWALLSGVASGVYSLGLVGLSESVATGLRARVMSFSFLPVLMGLVLGGMLAAPLMEWTVLAVFPLGAILTLVGIAAYRYAEGQPLTVATRVQDAA